MLMELKVSNFAIIENVHLQFKSGLNILTGETGAGKSVLLKSLALLMGVKGSSESIRTGFQQAAIEGSFDISHRADIQKKLKDLAIETEDNLLIVKRVLAEDKSRIYINGSLNTLNTLRDLVAPLIEVAGQAAPLIEMTGQFDNRHLLSKSYHLDLLDQYVGVFSQRLEFQKKFTEWKNLLEEISRLLADSQNKAQRLDFLAFQRDEIETLDLDPVKDLDLEFEIKRLKNSSRLLNFVDQAEDLLVSGSDAATQRLSVILKRAFELMQMDPEFAKKSEQLRQAKTLIEDVVFDLRQYGDKIHSDPQKLESMEQRLSGLRKLQKKFGTSIEEIFSAFVQIKSEIQTLQNIDTHVAEMQKNASEIHVQLKKLAKELHQRRLAGSKLLADSVNNELLDLNMKGVRFHVEVSELPELNITGGSDVEFMSQASTKDPHRPLAKFASGGELSRILLSLKRVVGSGQHPRTYLFDEVDAGVSGETAEKVGRKLHSIAQGQQVICVTHLPQVAAFGDVHFYIHKSNPTATNAKKFSAVSMEVEELGKQERVNEIARLISGEKISKTSLAHAQELLKEAR